VVVNPVTVRGEPVAVRGELVAVRGELVAVRGELVAVRGELVEPYRLRANGDATFPAGGGELATPVPERFFSFGISITKNQLSQRGRSHQIS